MKIEKINDNQIRCTLTHADLAERELKLSELAYGTEKAKSLFHDMMQQAAHEFGFEAENIPLMIEAIPASSDSIVLIITKVEDPEELDTRFSKFSPLPLGEAPDKKKNSMLDRLKKLEGADEFLDLLRHVTDAMSDLPEDVPVDSQLQALILTYLKGMKQSRSIPDFALLCFGFWNRGIHGRVLLHKLPFHSLVKGAAQNVMYLSYGRRSHINHIFRVCFLSDSVHGRGLQKLHVILLQNPCCHVTELHTADDR
mgnify:CR=1 FL=1